jgi:hypothetical protein
VTVYEQLDSRKRRLNIELKAHQPPWESFRKDLEKLVVENVPGMWFHTLEKANQRSWSSIESKLRQSFSSLQKTKRWEEALKKGRHAVHFVFCVLEPEEVRSFTVWFDGWEECLDRSFSVSNG